MQVRQLSAWPARLPSVQSLEKSQRHANVLHRSQANNPSAAAVARCGGAPAARIERATRSDAAWFGAKAGSQVYFHLADRAGSMSHTSAPLPGLGRGAGGRSARVRPGTPGLLRSRVLPCHFPRQHRSKRRGNSEELMGEFQLSWLHRADRLGWMAAASPEAPNNEIGFDLS